MSPTFVSRRPWRVATLAACAWLLALLTLGLTPQALAQATAPAMGLRADQHANHRADTAPGSASPKPTPSTSPGTPAPLHYQSPFAGYQRFDAPAVGNWRQANDTVRDIGGWRSYLREAQGSPSVDPAKPGKATDNAHAPHPHHGHTTTGGSR